MSTLPTHLPSDPTTAEFFNLYRLPVPARQMSLEGYWDSLPWQLREFGGWTLEGLRSSLTDYRAALPQATVESTGLRSLEVVGGCNKHGEPEACNLKFHTGEIVVLVGPTGAGKSRFLADIECLAQGDTPSRRHVRIDGCAPDAEMRFSGESRIVAQISQNMNFIMDLSAQAFLEMHAESRGLGNPRQAAMRVLDAANAMAGEPFAADTALTQLSGGQSRALMIADAALLSPKPIVLIDEIENAGVDRRRALDLFVRKGKIVFLSTHDPLLALAGTRRLVIARGAVVKIVEPSHREREYGQRLARFDRKLSNLREAMRRGESLDPHWQTLQF